MRSIMRNLVIVEGNISAGKSTLCQNLSDLLGMKVWTEPVIDNPYLERFYADPKKYALKMQLWLLRRRFETYLEALQHTMICDGAGVLLDRSVFSDYVFAVKNYQDGNISLEGFNYYLELREKMMRHLPLPAVTLYLDVKPEVCHHRIHYMRRRDCETGIELGYLQGLDECYTVMLDEIHKDGSHVLRLPWDNFGDVQRVAERLTQVLHQRQGEGVHPGLLPYVTELLADEGMRRQVMYLDHTIDELEDDDIAAAMDMHTTSSRVKRTSPASPTSASSSSSSTACKDDSHLRSPLSTPEKNGARQSATTAIQIEYRC